MTPPDALVRFVAPWSELYSDSSVLPTLIVFGHIAALVFAGGLAVTLDRGTLRAARSDADVRTRHLDELALAHRLVVAGLALSFFTGVLLFAADVETYFGSWIYWTKMGLVVLLLTNGFLMTRTEQRIRSAAGSATVWKRLRMTALASLILWFAVAFAGVALTNLA